MNRSQTITTGARRYALTILVIVYTFNFIDRYILAILLPAIKIEFVVDDRILGFLAGSAFALFYATLGIPIALIADRSNRRNLIALALVIWSGMTALSGVVTNIVHLTLARIGVGIGEVTLPLLARRYRVHIPVAAATSILVVIVTVMSASFTQFSKMIQEGGINAVPWNLICYTVPAVIIGGQIGPLLQGLIATRKVEMLIGSLFTVIGLAFIWIVSRNFL